MVEKTVDNDEKEVSSVDYEAKASEIGWTPKEKFRGDPAKFVEAKDYYEKAEHVLPIVKKQRDDFKAEAAIQAKAVAEMKVEIAETREAAKEAIAFMRAGVEREFNAKLISLKEAKKDAIDAGDGSTVIKIEEQIDSLKADKKEEKDKIVEKVTAETPQVHPDFPKWIDKNKWYATNDDMRQEADMLGARYAKQGLRDQLLWDKVRDEIEKRYPDEFSEESERPGVQRGGKSNGSGKTSKSFENLPADAKAACDSWIKRGLVKNRQQYLDNYEWSL